VDMKSLILQFMVMPTASLALFKKEKLSTVIFLVDNPVLVSPPFRNKFITDRHGIRVFWENFIVNGKTKCPLLYYPVTPTTITLTGIPLPLVSSRLMI
jgi:hypothetical protein